VAEKVVQCDYCGRVRIDGEWIPAGVAVDVTGMGICPTCLDYQRCRDEVKRVREARAVERRAREPHAIREMTEQDWERLK
jgi:hypothetical protein